MKNYTKYICALLLLVGENVSAWGITCTLYGGVGGNTVIGTIESTATLPNTAPDVDGWSFLGAWCTNRYSASTPTTTYPSGSYIKWYGNTPGDVTELYAVYASVCTEESTVYTGAPFIWYYINLEPRSGDSYAYVESGNYCFSVPGETITIKAVPEAGKTATACYVLDEGANEVTVTRVDETTFTFVMPSSEVDVEVSFVCPSLSDKSVTINEPDEWSYNNSTKKVDATITWNAVVGATKYEIRVFDKEMEEFLSTQTVTSTSYSLTGLENNINDDEIYTVEVRAKNDCGNATGWADKEISFYCQQPVSSTVTATPLSSTSVRVEWTEVTGISSYDVIITNEARNARIGDVHVVSLPTKSIDISGLSAGTNYYAAVQVTNDCGRERTYASSMFTTQYLVSFNANGGSGSMDGVEKDYGSTYALPACGFTAPSGKVFDGWAEGSAEGTKRTLPYNHTVTGNITFYALWRDASYTDYVFSCAELTLTGPTGDLVFITSAASKTVRSQEAFHVMGSGLTPSTTLTFAMSDPTIADKFAFKQADGSAVATDASGAIDMDFYVFYTPASGDTEDGLDIFTNLSASISGTKPKASAALTDKTVIGRHLPADFVIAAKKDGKWWALPSDMASTTNPKPSEIAVNDINNPSVAYTDASNKYGLAAPTASNISGGNGQYIRLTMSIEDGSGTAGPAPLFGSATGTRTLGKSSNAKATSDLSAGWWWQLKQTNTSITNPQDAKYTIYCANNTSSLRLRDNAGNPDWGFFASGVEELRLIPASSVVFTEAEIVAWGHHNVIVEVDKANAGGTGVAAEKVKALLNGAESSLITLAETKTSNGTGATKYDYTVTFGDVIDFAANEGQMLTLEWYNSSDVMIAVSNIMVPTIVASDITINVTNYPLKSNWNTEVHILPGKTVTVDAYTFGNNDLTIKELNIYPGATVNVTTGTLKATTLVMRNGWNRLNGDKKYDVARLYITPTNGNLQATNAYADWYIDFDQYYPIAVPWEVDLRVNDGSKIWYKNTKSKAVIGTTTGSVRLRYYDGASRAANVQVGVGESANWKLYGDDGCNPIPGKLEPGKAYAMTAKRPAGKAFSIIRMPLTIPSAAWTTGGEKGVLESTHKDQVTVSAYGDASTPSYAKGWNFIANPYMSLHKGELSYTDEGAIEYANIPDIDFQEYDQVPIVSTKLKPASGFLIQAPKNGTVTFGAVNRQASAPSYRKEVADETMPIQRVYITLAGDGAEDMMGILVGENYTAEYETNADLAKLLSNSNTLRTYMYYGEQNMAYLAISPVLAQEWIPVQVRLPAEGEYTFSLDNASVVENLEGVYLIDYANNDQITNLIEENYTFTTSAGTINGRFAINAVVGTRQTPTAIDVIGEGNKGNGPVKFIYHENVYIWHNGIIYDATGKKVK